MKRSLLNILLICLIFLAACSSSKKESEAKEEVNTVQIDSNMVLFPHMLPDSIFVANKRLTITFIDSMPIYNAVMSNQAVFLYAMQINKPNAQYDSLQFKIKMPNREKQEINFSISNTQFTELSNSFSHFEFKQFTKDLLKLNYTSRSNYTTTQAASMLDALNKVFAHKIEQSYKEQFPSNSTLFGFNSFDVFGMYYSEMATEKVGVGHDLISAISPSQDLLNEADKKALLALIEKHGKNFVPKSS